MGPFPIIYGKNMTISRIKNVWVRRTVLLVVFIPLVIGSIIVESVITAKEVFIDSLGAAKRAWEGK